ASNLARWPDLLVALEEFNVPEYLMRVIRDYLRNRILRYETEEGWREKDLSAGVAQGSIFGPDFWNILFDALLRLAMPDGVKMFAYADDVALVISAKNENIAQHILNTAMRRISEWMVKHGLEIAMAKTEIVPLTWKHINIEFPMTVGTNVVQTRSEVTYLGIKLDAKLTFLTHLKHVANKAIKKTLQLSRLMANTSGPKSSKRRLLMTVTTSILLYGSEIWANQMRKETHRSVLSSVQRRGALRVTSAYRTVSGPAVLVIAGIIPIELQAMERKRTYERKKTEDGTAIVQKEERQVTMETWQKTWNQMVKGRWTHVLIRELAPWVDRRYGEVNYYLTQFLSNHGYFCAYLSKMGKTQSPGCIFCFADRDDAYHTFFVCHQWNEERRQVERIFEALTPDNIISEMLSAKEKWDAMALFVESVLRKKKPFLDRAIELSANEERRVRLIPHHNLEAVAGPIDSGAEGDDEDSS
ncbi:reverse transcriptase domain-containing protein, partial [Escherichia coli]|uniref:reverse transcriptase domain-containing protein n=1 Tax=Escherichia coli TaxID=562 RepID=UPI002916E355